MESYYLNETLFLAATRKNKGSLEHPLFLSFDVQFGGAVAESNYDVNLSDDHFKELFCFF